MHTATRLTALAFAVLVATSLSHAGPFTPSLARAQRVAADAQAQERLTILVTSDDGVASLGLAALVDSLRALAHVIVVAPREQQSGMGHAITYREPIRVTEVHRERGDPWYAVDARPATTVRVALESLLRERPDLVVSGINAGENIGLSAWVSGTVAGAREAAFHGLPAIAFSMQGSDSSDFAAAAGYARRLVARLHEEGRLEPPLLLNVNIPAGMATRGTRGTRVTSLSLIPMPLRYEREVSAGGLITLRHQWLSPAGDHEGTDRYSFYRGFVTVTPLGIDQTDRTSVERVRAWLPDY